MKKVLSLLLAFTFLQVQTWALSGGPVYSNEQNPQRFIGSYAGVLIPESQTAAAVATSAATGVFTLGVPKTGLATGACVIFVDGVAYQGNMGGVVDPDKETLVGILTGESNFQIIIPARTEIIGGVAVVIDEQTTSIFAQGSVKCDVIEGTSGAFNGTSSTQTSTGYFAQTTTTTDAGSTNACRLEGTASVDVFAELDPATGQPNIINSVKFTVDGFRQTNTVTTTTTNFDFFF